MKNEIFVSILICCFNSEKFISKTIESIIKQNYNNFEIIFIDDGSADNTKQVINNILFEKKIKYQYFYQYNKGLASARNKGLTLANSDWIFILDHDDIMTKQRLENQVKEIKNNPDCAILFGDIILNREIKTTKFNEFKKYFHIDLFSILNKDNIQVNLLKYGCFIGSSSVVFNKQKAININGFNKKFSYCVDYDFFIRILKNNKFYVSKSIYSEWFENQYQISNKNFYKNNIEILKLYIENVTIIKLSILNPLILRNICISLLKIISNSYKN